MLVPSMEAVISIEYLGVPNVEMVVKYTVSSSELAQMFLEYLYYNQIGVIMPTLAVSGFFTENQAEMMLKDLEEADSLI